MVDAVDSPEEFERAARQTPNIARLEEEQYDSTADIIEYRAYLSSDASQRVQTGEDTLIDTLRDRFLELGAETVELDDESELVVFYPYE